MVRTTIALVLVWVTIPAARAEMPARFIPPVDAGVIRAFYAPMTAFGPGHRGIDYSVQRGTNARAASSGTIAFAGTVAGTLAVTIDHGGGIETTYSDLSSITVAEGDPVSEGTWIGSAGEAHDGTAGLHFGMKLNGVYVDPASFLVPVDVASAIHLAPVVDVPESMGRFADLLVPAPDAGSASDGCTNENGWRPVTEPPNDHIAVAVAGITSKTRGGVDADIYEPGPEGLGYPPGRVYRFSYAGIDGDDLHTPYDRSDTYGDIRTAAARLRALMIQIGKRHPGAEVDLIAHSQGGIVARTYLTENVDVGDPLPRVDHLVTFSSPHRGAPAAAQVAPLYEQTVTGRYLLGAARSLARSGAPVPDPYSTAVAQLAPGSELLSDLAREDVAFGTRVLTLAIPNDPVVPADHASLPGAQTKIVAPAGGFGGGHSAIVSSPEALEVARRFLRDGSTCPGPWDRSGLDAGRRWSWVEERLAVTLGALERGFASALPGGAALFVYDAVRAAR